MYGKHPGPSCPSPSDNHISRYLASTCLETKPALAGIGAHPIRELMVFKVVPLPQAVRGKGVAQPPECIGALLKVLENLQAMTVDVDADGVSSRVQACWKLSTLRVVL